MIRYDKSGDNHYDTVSAFIKSMRGSDPDAAVYYLARMLYAGEDIRFIARRIMICAAEDVGNADPQALQVAVAASLAAERLGMPEAQIVLSQAVTYVAGAPKSNAACEAVFHAMKALGPAHRWMRITNQVQNWDGEAAINMRMHIRIIMQHSSICRQDWRIWYFIIRRKMDMKSRLARILRRSENGRRTGCMIRAGRQN